MKLSFGEKFTFEHEQFEMSVRLKREMSGRCLDMNLEFRKGCLSNPRLA